MAPTVDAEQEGPCLDAAGSTVMIRCDDLAADSRWPQFAAAAVAASVRSVLSFQLYTHGPNTGALNLFKATAPEGSMMNRRQPARCRPLMRPSR